MAVIRTVAHVAHGTASTALTAVRHPVSTTAQGLGLAKGAVAYGLGVVRGTPPAPPIREETRTSAAAEPAVTPEPSTPPERDLPGPDLAVAAVPEIDELPEPIVIEADDTVGGAFHNEPKASSRDSEHGGPAGDREEVEGYDEEIVTTDELDLDLETPGTEPLLDPAIAKAIRSEAETLQQGADPQKG